MTHGGNYGHVSRQCHELINRQCGKIDPEPPPLAFIQIALPGLFFVPVKWNPNFVSWSLLESLQSLGAGMWVMVSSVVRAS